MNKTTKLQLGYMCEDYSQRIVGEAREVQLT